MSELYDAGQALARHLVVELAYVPLEQALPGLEPTSQTFDAALAAFEGPDLRIHAFLLDEDTGHPAVQAEGLRQALVEQEERIPGRIKANVWLLVQEPLRAAERREDFLKFEDGHFLAKTLVGRGVLCLSSGQAWSSGRSASQPGAAELAAWMDPAKAPAEDAFRREIALRKADDRQARRLLKGSATPLVWFLISLNVVAYVFQNALAVALSKQGVANPWSVAMHQLGSNDPAFTVAKGEWWRLLSACFLHDGLPHILLNMMSLFSLGSLAERLCGPWRLMGLYLACGLAASTLSALTGTAGIASVGASGAILGLAGALLAPHWRRDPRFPKDLSDRLFSWLAKPIGFLFVLGFGLKFLDLPLQLDNFAHLGGLLCGFGVAYIYPPFLIRKTDRKV